MAGEGLFRMKGVIHSKAGLIKKVPFNAFRRTGKEKRTPHPAQGELSGRRRRKR